MLTEREHPQYFVYFYDLMNKHGWIQLDNLVCFWKKSFEKIDILVMRSWIYEKKKRTGKDR